MQYSRLGMHKPQERTFEVVLGLEELLGRKEHQPLVRLLPEVQQALVVVGPVERVLQALATLRRVLLLYQCVCKRLSCLQASDKSGREVHTIDHETRSRDRHSSSWRPWEGRPTSQRTAVTDTQNNWISGPAIPSTAGSAGCQLICHPARTYLQMLEDVAAALFIVVYEPGVQFRAPGRRARRKLAMQHAKPSVGFGCHGFSCVIRRCQT